MWRVLEELSSTLDSTKLVQQAKKSKLPKSREREINALDSSSAENRWERGKEIASKQRWVGKRLL